MAFQRYRVVPELRRVRSHVLHALSEARHFRLRLLAPSDHVAVFQLVCLGVHGIVRGSHGITEHCRRRTKGVRSGLRNVLWPCSRVDLGRACSDYSDVAYLLLHAVSVAVHRTILYPENADASGTRTIMFRGKGVVFCRPVSSAGSRKKRTSTHRNFKRAREVQSLVEFFASKTDAIDQNARIKTEGCTDEAITPHTPTA